MESILVILVLTAIFFIIKSDLSSDLRKLNSKIDLLTKELKQLKGVEAPAAKSEPEKKAAEKPFPHEEYKAPAPVPAKEEKKEPERPRTSDDIVREREEITPVPPALEHRPVAAMSSYEVPKPIKQFTPTPPKPGFFEKNPDLEKFIGENLANKIGIAILVLGIGFFVKFAIDREWINETGRVFIGVICGGILIGIAHYLRKSFNAFSSVLVGGGIAILYFTIAIAFHEYQLLGQTASFVIMVLITAFAVLLSIGYDRRELAVLAILGGFASPFMVSTGEGNYIVLFSYILILNIGMLILAYFKKWNIVNLICYGFTILLFGGWLGTKFNGNDLSMTWGALLFATLFYLVFFLMNIINNIKERTSFKAIEISVLLSNTFLYYTAGMIILHSPFGSEFKGLFTASLGVFNFIFAFMLYRSQKVDKNLVFLLIGLVLTFISLAAPIQLKGNYITLFWAAEVVLLLWLSQKSGIALMKYASIIVMALMSISLVMDWSNIYYGTYPIVKLPVLLNKGYITGLFAIASLGGILFLLKNETEESVLVKLPGFRIVLSIAVVIVLYTMNLLELRHQLGFAFNHMATISVIEGCYNMLFILLLVFIGKKLPVPGLVKNSSAFLGVAAILAYLFYYHREIQTARNSFLVGEASGAGFYFHYLLVFLLLFISIRSLMTFRKLNDFNRETFNVFWWFFSFFFIFIATAELDHHVLLFSYNESTYINTIVSQNSKISYPILWGVSSFALIAIGLKQKIKMLRIISLSLFLVTLLKLFIFDIRGVSEGGKIAAFISLGILLLIVSFMYQKLKLLLIDDDVPVTNTNATE